MENDFRINKINAKEEVEFHNKGKHSWWWQLEQIYFNTGCKQIQNWTSLSIRPSYTDTKRPQRRRARRNGCFRRLLFSGLSPNQNRQSMWFLPCVNVILEYCVDQLFFLFIGRKPTTWPANNCLQIMVCSCAMSSNFVWLQIIFCSRRKRNHPFLLLREKWQIASLPEDIH